MGITNNIVYIHTGARDQVTLSEQKRRGGGGSGGRWTLDLGEEKQTMLGYKNVREWQANSKFKISIRRLTSACWRGIRIRIEYARQFLEEKNLS